MKIVVAVSGGMDSLYALKHLKDEGHDVAALHARFISTENDPVPALSALCKKWEIPIHVADLRDEFRTALIIPFLRSYAHGETPNPCALCNKYMKFGRLLDIARNLSAEVLASGHYVDMENFVKGNISYGLCLKSADDKSKDQSYFLALTPLDRLRLAIFPLAHKIKKEISDELTAKNISIPVNKESQEVCFIPNDNYRDFIETEGEKRKISYTGTGDILFRGMQENTLIEKKVGTHEGLWRYTEGQRKGLGIAWTDPLYVIEKNEESNTLYVGTQESLSISHAYASQINFLVPPQLWSENIFVRTRYRENPSAAKISFFIQNDTNANNEKLCTTEIPDASLMTEQTNISQLNDLENTYKEQGSTQNIFDNPASCQLFHVQEDNNRFETEQDQVFFKQRQIWNAMPLSLIVKFEEEKQVYAKGQVLAIYDEKGFVLAGAILY